MPSVQDRHFIKKTDFESGKTQRRYKRRLGSVWTLTFKTTFEELLAIRAFFNARKGSFEPFLWTDPWSGESKTVHFFEDNADWESEFRVNGIFSVKLEEDL